MNILQRTAARGKAIICFQADGCMAHDHKFLWVGIIRGFHIQEVGEDILLADVAIMKYAGDPQDVRDKPISNVTVIAANISKLNDALYMVMK